MFSKLCIEEPQNIGSKYFEKIEYDKTLNERGRHDFNPVEFARGERFIEVLEEYLESIPNVVACRITGSFPAVLDGTAKYKVKEVIDDTSIVLERTELTKKPDIDLEVLTDGEVLLSNHKVIMDAIPQHRRISVGYIDFQSIQWNVKTVVRWGFLKNEYIVKGYPVYKDLSKKAWEYINGWCKEDTVRFVGRLHTYYAIKNSMKYGRLESFRITRNDDPQMFDAVRKWKSTPTELYYKEDL